MKILPSAIFALFLVPLLSLDSLQAAPSNLYLGSVTVAEQSPAEQARAMPLALAQVVQKLTGLTEFGEYPELEQAFKNARSLAITFYYRKRELSLPDGNEGEELRLLVEFSPPAVTSLIQAMSLPIWNPTRPPLTVWLVIDDGLSRRILPIDFDYAWQSLADVAAARGMPVIRPQPDSEGTYSVDPQLLWGGYTEELVASGPADALLIAALREGPEWTVRMNLDYSGNRWSWRNRDSELQTALREGMSQAVDDIAAANSIAAADQGKSDYIITVTGITSADDYVRCLTYLEGVSLVTQVRVVQAGPGRAQFELTLNALPEYFLAAVATGETLAASAKNGEYSLLP